MKLKSLITCLALQWIKEVGMIAKLEHVSIAQDIEFTCKIQWYTIILHLFNIRHANFPHYKC